MNQTTKSSRSGLGSKHTVRRGQNVKVERRKRKLFTCVFALLCFLFPYGCKFLRQTDSFPVVKVEHNGKQGDFLLGPMGCQEHPLRSPHRKSKRN